MRIALILLLLLLSSISNKCFVFASDNNSKFIESNPNIAAKLEKAIRHCFNPANFAEQVCKFSGHSFLKSEGINAVLRPFVATAKLTRYGVSKSLKETLKLVLKVNREIKEMSSPSSSCETSMLPQEVALATIDEEMSRADAS